MNHLGYFVQLKRKLNKNGCNSHYWFVGNNNAEKLVIIKLILLGTMYAFELTILQYILVELTITNQPKLPFNLHCFGKH